MTIKFVWVHTGQIYFHILPYFPFISHNSLLFFFGFFSIFTLCSLVLIFMSINFLPVSLTFPIFNIISIYHVLSMSFFLRPALFFLLMTFPSFPKFFMFSLFPISKLSQAPVQAGLSLALLPIYPIVRSGWPNPTGEVSFCILYWSFIQPNLLTS